MADRMSLASSLVAMVFLISNVRILGFGDPSPSGEGFSIPLLSGFMNSECPSPSGGKPQSVRFQRTVVEKLLLRHLGEFFDCHVFFVHM
jgi:hypothetical protein